MGSPDPPGILIFKHHPREHSLSRLSRRSVGISVALDTPLDMNQHEIGLQKLRLNVSGRPDAFLELHLMPLGMLLFDLLPAFPVPPPDVYEIGIVSE
jgi:hypothetical protein